MSQTATDNSYWSYPTATASTVSYTANNLDQYTAVGSVTPTYDGNGNLTFDGVFTYGYDAENRLTSATGASNTAAYAYDAQGRRKSKTVNGTTTIFVQDPQGRALLDYDGGGGTIQNWYAFGAGPNDVLNQVNVTNSTRATTIPDIQGSIVASLDASSGTLTKAGYQTYGESSVTSGTFRYTGARIDAETNGLYDFRARMYSPTLGRFMQADPTGAKGGINLYAYVYNDPLNLIDPFGLCPACQTSGSSFLQSTVNVVPGAYYAGLAQQQFQQGNYGAATLYAAETIVNSILGAITFGLSTEVGTGVRAGTTIINAADELAANRAAGAAFEQAVGASLEQSGLTVGQQITVGTENGVRTRLDFLTLDPLTGQIGCIECKASQTAPLTPNQSLAFPQIGQSGGKILGAGSLVSLVALKFHLRMYRSFEVPKEYSHVNRTNQYGRFCNSRRNVGRRFVNN